MIKTITLALKLFLSSTDATASAECEALAVAGSDLHAECMCALEDWRCEAQGWCSSEAEPLGLAAFLLPPVLGEIPVGCQ